MSIIQPETGFGYSNFRRSIPRPETLHPIYNKIDKYTINENEYKKTNPLYQLEYDRNSNFLFREHYNDYNLVDQDKQEKIPDNYVYFDIIKNYHEMNPVIRVFFSKRNLDHLQKLIIDMIKFQTQGLYNISRQSDNELLIVMRSIYIQTSIDPYASGKNLQMSVCILNKNVLNWVVPKIIVKIQQYLGYVRDSSNNYMPLQRPEYVSDTGMRINQMYNVNYI